MSVAGHHHMTAPFSQAQILWVKYKQENIDYASLATRIMGGLHFKIETKVRRRAVCDCTYPRDDPMFTTINVISRNEATQLYGAILPVALTNEDIRNSESYKEYYAMASGTIPPKTKGSKKKALIQMQSPKTMSSTCPNGKRMVLEQMIGTGYYTWVPEPPDYDSDDDISWKGSCTRTMIKNDEQDNPR
ncbi:hypothetical protein Tco_1383718 [Tanacetum coccineum]